MFETCFKKLNSIGYNSNIKQGDKIKGRDTCLPLILRWSRILMSYVGMHDHGLADGRLDPAFQRGSCLNKDKGEVHLRDKERGKKKRNGLGIKTFQNTNSCQPYQFGLKMTMRSSSSLPPFLACWPTELLDTYLGWRAMMHVQSNPTAHAQRMWDAPHRWWAPCMCVVESRCMCRWSDLGLLRPTACADGRLLAGLSTLVQGVPLKNNEGYLKTYIKLGPDLENSFKVFYIWLFCIFILIYSNIDMYCMCICLCYIYCIIVIFILEIEGYWNNRPAQLPGGSPDTRVTSKVRWTLGSYHVVMSLQEGPPLRGSHSFS